MVEQGGYAERVAADASQCYRLPDAMSFIEAASMSLAYDTAWFALRDRARVQPGDSVLVLGASGWQMFWRVTLPNIRWGMLYGLVLLTARTIGEFGAVSVVSGHIRGETNTIPLYVEILYNEYNFAAAFAIASVLTGLALLSLVARSLLRVRV